MSGALKREYPFDDAFAEYAGAVPEPVDQDETRASGLTLPELRQIQGVVSIMKRAIDKHSGCPVKREAVRAMLRSAADI